MTANTDESSRANTGDIDNAEAAARRSLQRELLVGLEGKDALVNDADWDDTEQVAIRVLEARKGK